MENIQTKKAHDPNISGPEEVTEKKDLDKVSAERFRRVEAWFLAEQEAQAENRFLMSRDQDMVDGFQWTEEEKAELESRNQPALVFNLIATTIRWITGTEKRTRVDYRVYGRGEEDTKSAENKTFLLKYLDDVNHGGFERSKAFDDSTGAGIGWVETGIKADPGCEPLFENYESWRNVWHDRFSQKHDCSDGRYIFRARWVDLDVAKAYFPKQTKELELAAEDHEYYFADDEFEANPSQYTYTSEVVGRASAGNLSSIRQRVRLVECWYKEAKKCDVIKSKCGANKALMDQNDKRLAQVAQENEMYQAVRQEMRVMIFVSGRENRVGQMLYDGKSPYWHNRFPLVPCWCYRAKRNNQPYGVVRNLVDPQVDLNKRHSKATYILSTNKVIMESGAVLDKDILAEEMARPDSIIEYVQGKKFDVNVDRSLAAEHIQMMGRDAEYIQRVGGVTDENLGRQTNATSGKAIEKRQDQGTTVTADLFDNYRMFMQTLGELKLSLIEQYYDEPKTIRLIGDRGKEEFKQINDDYSIVDSQADFIVDAESFNATVRQAMFEQLFDLVAKLPPEMAIQLLDVVIEMSDIPEREEIVARIRQINGMKDGDKEPTPEEIAQQEAQQQEEQKAKEREDRMMEAKVSQEEAKAIEYGNKNMAAGNEAVLKKLEAMETALTIAGLIKQQPGIGEGADMVMQDAVK